MHSLQLRTPLVYLPQYYPQFFSKEFSKILWRVIGAHSRGHVSNGTNKWENYKYRHLWWDDLQLCTVDLARHPGRDMDGYNICATALLCLVAVSFLPQHLLLLDPSEAKLYSSAFASVTCQLWESSPSSGVDPFQHLIWAFEEEKDEEPFPRIKEKKQLVTRVFFKISGWNAH